MGHGGSQQLTLRFVCPLEPKLVSRTRQYVSDAARAINIDAETAGRLGLAVHELMENSVKYSIEPTAEISVEVDSGEEGSFTVRTRNRSDASSVRELRERLSELCGAADPMDLYELVIRRSISLGSEQSGLGLARIRAEADLELNYQLDGDHVTISASGRRSAKHDDPAKRADAERSAIG